VIESLRVYPIRIGFSMLQMITNVVARSRINLQLELLPADQRASIRTG